MLTSEEIKILRSWDAAAAHFRRRYESTGKSRFRFKDYAFREVYGNLITQTMRLLPGDPKVLKTDLWNEGIEDGRSLAGYVKEGDLSPICADISQYVCESANRLRNSGFHPVQATILAPPFRDEFDLILDVSTVDHMPKELRRVWMESEARLLRGSGILLISFDCRLNLFNELYHRLFTRKIYPEWTLAPSEIREQLRVLGFQLIREHAIFIAGFFWGTHRPLFPLAGILRRKRVFSWLTHVELSKLSRWLSFFAPQYIIVARKRS
jgi:SAM-dependent methyltransferase